MIRYVAAVSKSLFLFLLILRSDGRLASAEGDFLLSASAFRSTVHSTTPWLTKFPCFPGRNSWQAWKQNLRPRAKSGGQRTTSQPLTPRKSTITLTSEKSTGTVYTLRPSTLHQGRLQTRRRMPIMPRRLLLWCISDGRRTRSSCASLNGVSRRTLRR
jgi:hypothetical protein